MGYRTVSGLMDDERNALARVATGYDGPFKDAPDTEGTSEWAQYRLDPKNQAAWIAALTEYRAAGSPNMKDYIERNFK